MDDFTLLSDCRLLHVTKQILSLLSHEPKKLDEIADAIGEDRAISELHLSYLIQEGIISKTTIGGSISGYTITDKGRLALEVINKILPDLMELEKLIEKTEDYE
jgi:predicted transcriptional regulator